ETAMRADGTCEREPGMPVTVFADLAVQHGFRLARTGAGDDVDDAAQRVRSVDRGLRAAHDLDPLDVPGVEDREIERSAARVVRVVHADAVDEHHREVRLAAPDEDGGDAAAATRLRDLKPGYALQEIQHAGGVGSLDIGPIEHGVRGRQARQAV